MITLLIASKVGSFKDCEGLVGAWARQYGVPIDALIVLGLSEDGGVQSMERALSNTRVILDKADLTPAATLALPSPADLSLGYSTFNNAFYEPLMGVAYNYKKGQNLHLPGLSLTTLNTISCLDHLGFCGEDLLSAMKATQAGTVTLRGIVHYHGLLSWAPDLRKSVPTAFRAACLNHNLRFGLFGDACASMTGLLQSFGTAPGNVSLFQCQPSAKRVSIFRPDWFNGWYIPEPTSYRIQSPETPFSAPRLPRHGEPLPLEGL